MSKTNIEKSCGAVIFESRKKDAKVLIIRQLAGHYCFVKGHMESNETEAEMHQAITAYQTALQTKNIDVDWLEQYKQTQDYTKGHYHRGVE